MKKKLDIKEMKKGIKYFLGTHDFSAFRASSCTAKNPIKTILQAKVKKSGDKISIIFVSKVFSSETSKINGWLFKICR